MCIIIEAFSYILEPLKQRNASNTHGYYGYFLVIDNFLNTLFKFHIEFHKNLVFCQYLIIFTAKQNNIAIQTKAATRQFTHMGDKLLDKKGSALFSYLSLAQLYHGNFKHCLFLFNNFIFKQIYIFVTDFPLGFIEAGN